MKFSYLILSYVSIKQTRDNIHMKDLLSFLLYSSQMKLHCINISKLEKRCSITFKYTA